MEILLKEKLYAKIIGFENTIDYNSFSASFAGSDLTQKAAKHLPVFGRERLQPPPEDGYALHRKLSGSFMACIKLGARVPCRGVLERQVELIGV